LFLLPYSLSSLCEISIGTNIFAPQCRCLDKPKFILYIHLKK
jgi:hypothetical protein